MLSKTLIVISLMILLCAFSMAQNQGSLTGWGSDVDFSNSLIVYGQATGYPDSNDFMAIDAGLHHSIALKTDGTITAWGDNTYGQSSPPEDDDFVAVAAGANHNLAIFSNGSLASWGDSSWGLESQTPAGNDFIAVSAGAKHSLALRSDGTLAAWGTNSGQVSDFDYGQVRDTPSDSNFISVGSGTYHGLAIATEPGDNTGTIKTWGFDPDDVDLGDGDYVNYHLQAPPSGSDFIAVAAGAKHSLALRSDGTLVAWGVFVDSGSKWEREFYFDFGQVTDTPSDGGYIAIATGDYHNIAMKSDGSLISWGRDNKDQVTGTPGESNFTAIAAGGYHCLAIDSNIEITKSTLSVLSSGATNVPIDSSSGPGGTTNYYTTLEAGTTVSLTAPATWDGKTFINWTGGTDSIISTNETISLTMDVGKSVTANYTKYTLSVSSAGASGLDISSGTGHGGTTDYDISLEEDTLVFLTAPTSVGGKSFTGWLGLDEPSESTTIFFYMDSDKSATAIFGEEFGCLYQLAGDFDGDCRVSLSDFQILAFAWVSTYSLPDLESMTGNWLTDCGFTPYHSACVTEPDCPYQLAGDLDDNCRVDLLDFHILASAWLSGYTVSDLQSMTGNWLTDCRLTPFDTACVFK